MPMTGLIVKGGLSDPLSGRYVCPGYLFPVRDL